MRFSSPTAFMAQKKEILDEALGDIVGLPDSSNFKISGSSGELLHFKGLPSFSARCSVHRAPDHLKAKQLYKG